MPQAVQVEYLVSGIMHSGEPLASGQVYFYETDGTTAKTIWNDANKSSTASNPVTLDSNGKGEIFADGTYTVLIKTSAGSTIQTLENQYFFPNSGTVTTSEIDASSFGASNNATISTAVTSASGADRTVYLNPGNWAISDNLTIPSNINLKFLMGAYVTVANTKTLTIQGTVEGPNYNIFRGDGTVTYAARTNIIPSIWAIGGSHDNLSLDGTVTIKDNLIVNGTTTTINSTVVTIDDPIFTLGGDTAPSSDDNKDRGIEFRYHTGSAAKVGFFGYDDSTQKFSFLVDATNSSETFSGTTGTIVANLEGNVTGTLQTAAQTNITSVGTLSSLTVSGDATFNTSMADITSSVFSDMHVKMSASTPVNTNGAVGIAMAISTIANYGVTLAARRLGTDGTSVGFELRRHVASDIGVVEMSMNGNGVISGDFNDTSDRKLKKDIEYNVDPEKVFKLKPAKYKWNEKQSKSDDLRYGFIAQDVESVIPESISENCEGYKTINTIGILAHVVATIKELKSEIDTLQELKQELDLIKNG